jgi:phage tail sheath protein FI
MISIDPALSGYFVVQGRTLTDVTGKDRINLVRINDKIRRDLFFNLQSYKGETNSKVVRTQIASAISAYMSTLARSGYITSYNQPVIDETNNPSSAYYTGTLNISLSYSPIYPIDAIVITLTRDVSGNVSVA